MSNTNICPKCHQPRVRLTDGTLDCGCYADPAEYPEGYPSAAARCDDPRLSQHVYDMPEWDRSVRCEDY